MFLTFCEKRGSLVLILLAFRPIYKSAILFLVLHTKKGRGGLICPQSLKNFRPFVKNVVLKKIDKQKKNWVECLEYCTISKNGENLLFSVPFHLISPKIIHFVYWKLFSCKRELVLWKKQVWWLLIAKHFGEGLPTDDLSFLGQGGKQL